MIKKFILLSALVFAVGALNAQTEEELKALLGPKKDSIAAIQGRVNAIQAKLDGLPGWKKGAFGTIGGSLSGFNNWFSQEIANNESGTIGITVNAFANLKQENYFWRNSALVNVGWIKLDDLDTSDDDNDFRVATDVFTLTSLFGYNLTKNLAVSTLAEYRTALVGEDVFNNPGYLDFGVGATWTPIKDLVVVIHPLNYNLIFSDDDFAYESSLGAKIVADYTRKIGAVSFKTNLSAFLSYEEGDYSNWTWTNSFAYTFWKQIGVGFDFGLRSNKQEAFNWGLSNPTLVDNPSPTLEGTDNELQTFWNLGLSYSF